MRNNDTDQTPLYLKYISGLALLMLCIACTRLPEINNPFASTGVESTSTDIPLSDPVSIRNTTNEDLIILRYNLPKASLLTLKLYDDAGRLKYIEKLQIERNGFESAVDLSLLQVGQYHLEVYSANDQLLYKKFGVGRAVRS